jgi:phthiodiolone/phenolphthiodiolone dimycocerosates ketoreductase
MRPPLTTAIPCIPDRTIPMREIGEFAKALEAGGVDYMLIWDQLVGFLPRALWRPENTPWASLSPDPDSFHDWGTALAVAGASTEKLGVGLCGTDAVRNGPAELLQRMMSLADLTGGRAFACVGAGEVKQAKPFGYKRSEGLARLEDLLHIVNLLRDADEPISFEGNIWKLNNAYIGATKPKILPKFFALGGGPKLMEISTHYADGYTSFAPFVFPTVEGFANNKAMMDKMLVEQGRDPVAFTQGMGFVVLCHEDPAVIELALNNPLLKFFASIGGRVNQSAWLDEGIEPVWPPDWHYALKLFPPQITFEECQDVVNRTPRKLVERSFIAGTPSEVADAIVPYVAAGADWIAPCDLLPLILPPEEAGASLPRMLEVLRLVKERVGPAAS